MIDRPDFVHLGISRMVDAMLARLDQLEAQDALALNNNNVRVGAGGLGCSDELPQPDFDGAHVRPIDLWGTATAQIFSEVSPAMHEEFALRYELKWLSRFGLNCYGCCEPVHLRFDYILKIPHIRRVSISPWADQEKSAERLGPDHVFSRKPNPSLVSVDFEEDAIREDIRDTLRIAGELPLEIILKDTHTFEGDATRPGRWVRIALEEVESYMASGKPGRSRLQVGA